MIDSVSKFMLLLFAGIGFATAHYNKKNLTKELLFQSPQNGSASVKPEPLHIVVVILENHDYFQVLGSKDAPFINSLIKDKQSAVFSKSFSIEHPSQPNYLDIYSGNNQGISTDGHPSKEPFTTPNLGRQLLDAGKSFVTYAEDLPFAGYNGNAYKSYVRHHNPAANWMGTGNNQIPVTCIQPFTAFPTDYTQLPTVSLVIPNQQNDMHDGSVLQADEWIKNNFGNYIQWAKTHNSLFILTFDEDDYSGSDHILTLFTGEMVKGGTIKDQMNHFNLLRTMEWIYDLPFAGNAAKVKPIENCWK